MGDMTTIVKIHRKGQMTLPSRIRAALGVDEGDLVEASVEDGKIVLTPTLVIDRSKFPTANNEYTPAQRRVIDVQLAKAKEDVKKGRLHGPFESHEELMEFLHNKARRGGGRKVKKNLTKTR